ncbi:hypothetical protein [Haloarchaeobius amylolyticus]|uniref:hypothetical protein n=1 Tax=Haloarchaeobius amylolyticus TaxID=1198296 RepID=UPI00226E8131|nr:hypothetical protein [Haloarchaeobius amylolyticus]
MALLRAGVLGVGIFGGLFFVAMLLAQVPGFDGPAVFLAAGFVGAGALLGVGLFRAVFRA